MSNKRVTKKVKMQREERKKRQQQKKFIDDLKKEIDTLEDSLQHVGATNVKRAVIKNVRIAGRKVLKWLPTVAAGIIISVPFTNYVGVPFRSVPVSQPARVEQKVDTLGHINEKRQLIDFDSSSNYLDFYSGWQEDGDHYTRTIKRYFISEEIVNQCIEVANGDLITNFDSMFGVPNYVVNEKSNNLTEEEINTGPYAEIVHYFTDENDRGIRMTTAMEIIGVSFFYICAVLAADFGMACATKRFRTSCDGKVSKYKVDYKPLDRDEIKKELKLKRDNYTTLVGE